MWYETEHLRLVLFYFAKFALLFAGALTLIVVAVKIPQLLGELLAEIKSLREEVGKVKALLEKSKG